MYYKSIITVLLVRPYVRYTYTLSVYDTDNVYVYRTYEYCMEYLYEYLCANAYTSTVWKIQIRKYESCNVVLLEIPI